MPIVGEDLLRRFYKMFYLQFCDSIDQWKNTVAKVLHENNRNYNSYRFSCKLAFILFLSFLTNQKQESSFQQVGLFGYQKYFFFVYSESHSASKLYRIQ